MLRIENKKGKSSKLNFLIIILYLFFVSDFIYAGTIIYDDDQMMYKTDDGILARDVWVWLDVNDDSIAECYRFDGVGHIIKNYESHDGKRTNDKGQLIEDDIVIKKMLTNGKIIKSPGNVIGDSGNIIDKILSIGKSDKNKKPTADNIDGKTIKTVDLDEDFIGPIAIPESGILYSKNNSVNTVNNTSDNVINNKREKIVAGKNIKKFITNKQKCDDDVEEVVIYGGTKWEDVIELNGNGASIKLNIKDNNYIYFEVAHEIHYEDEKDVNLVLQVYVDGELHDTLDEFADSDYQSYEEWFYDKEKVVELKVSIEGGAYNRRVFIRNGRLRKLKLDEDE